MIWSPPIKANFHTFNAAGTDIPAGMATMDIVHALSSVVLTAQFSRYVEDRRREPRNDVLTALERRAPSCP